MKVTRLSSVGMPAFLALACAVWLSVAAQTQQSPRSHAPRRLAVAADTTFQHGLHAKLPPHISTLLGISRETESPVMQSVVRTGKMVQGIDVLVKNKNDIVLFVADETANDRYLYLTSPEGTLRKVISVKAGAGEVVPITDEVKTAFKKEIQFWVDRLPPAHTTK